MTEFRRADHRPRTTLLCVLDGWGHREARDGNAVALAATPVFDDLWANRPRRLLRADGPWVGLPDGQFGNSEVGHLHLGAGRVVPQLLPRIDKAVARDDLSAMAPMRRFAERVRAAGGRAQLFGLISDGGVHSHRVHMLALARAATALGLEVDVHAVTDGRDTPPGTAAGHLAWLDERLPEGARVASVIGRYFAMDRDRRWKRVARAYDAMTAPREDAAATNAAAALAAAAARGESDEFVTPTPLAPIRAMRDGDGLICANFRADRARQILRALLLDDFDGFERGARPRFADAIGVARYAPDLDASIEGLFPPPRLEALLGDVLSRAGFSQARVAETEKFPHVTYFFDGGDDASFPGVKRYLSPSPNVATYDLAPEMAAEQVRDDAKRAILDGAHDFVLVNFANPDMVGHTGDLDAAIEACAVVDRCLGDLVEALARVGGVGLVTADHGNADRMVAENGGPHTAHTLAPAPVIALGATRPMRGGDASLVDVAPTILDMMGLARPDAMSGRSLFDG